MSESEPAPPPPSGSEGAAIDDSAGVTGVGGFAKRRPKRTGEFETRLRRRMVTIPAVMGGAVAVTMTFPLLFTVAFLTDLACGLGRRGWATTRMLLMLESFLLVESVGLCALGIVGCLTAPRSPGRLRATYALQGGFAAALLAAVKAIFGLRFSIEGEELVAGGPLIVFIRHSSTIDTLIPTELITRRHGLKLRFVMKTELLADPCLDVAGHWVPNYFVLRSGSAPGEIDAIRALKSNLGPDEGILIYPEGTRFTKARQRVVLDRLKGDPLALQSAADLKHLLPARVGGPLALVNAAPTCDVLFVGHHGLEGYTDIGAIWARGLHRRTVRVRFWRERAASIPRDEDTQRAWLAERWQQMDDWIAAIPSEGGHDA